MKKILTGLFLFATSATFAQSTVSTRISSGMDLGAAFDTKVISPSFAYYQMLHLDSRKIFQIGWTFKVQTLYNNNTSIDYYTAPAKLTRGETGFSALSASVIPANIDTLTFKKATFTSANFGLRALIHLGPVDVGASADIVGIGFGRGRYALHRSSVGNIGKDTLTFHNTQQYAQPQRINFRFLGDNDLGFLSTEVFARISFSRRLAVKAGYQWIATEYKTSNALAEGNNRFRRRHAMPYVALTFPFFR